MREVTDREKIQRGCAYCRDKARISKARKNQGGKLSGVNCPHKRCPYRELDKYSKYTDYLKETTKDYDSYNMIYM